MRCPLARKGNEFGKGEAIPSPHRELRSRQLVDCMNKESIERNEQLVTWYSRSPVPSTVQPYRQRGMQVKYNFILASKAIMCECSVTDPDQIIAKLLHCIRCCSWEYSLRVMGDEDCLKRLKNYYPLLSRNSETTTLYFLNV